jgi:hypothetical protein
MQKIKLAFAASILAGAFLLTPTPAETATTCPTGCRPCNPASPFTLCCKANSPQLQICSFLVG